MRTANRVRTPERAASAESERTAALVGQLVDQLGQMRGAAMKVGQMISMVDFDGLPEDQRDELQRRLAALRDDVPPVRFADLEKLMRQEFGGPLERVFSDFDEQAFAAASIGQVHRATTVDGEDVAVKIQYPGVAEAVETDLRNATLLLPARQTARPRAGRQGDGVARCASASPRSSTTSSRRRISAASGASCAGTHSSWCRRSARTSRRAACSSPNTSRGRASRRSAGPTRRSATAMAEIVFRLHFGLLYRDRIALGDPHPGNYLLTPDGRVCFLDFGLVRYVAAERIAAERAIALAVREGDAAALKKAAAQRRLSARRASRRPSMPNSRCG